MRRILAAFADYERAVIATRTKMGRRESVRKNGTFAGGHGVYGYRPVGNRGEPGSGRLQIVGEEVAAIRLVFEFRAEGLTLAQIADRLTQAGHVTKSGSQFTHVQVYRIMAREDFYRGVSVITKSISSDSVCHEAAL